MAAAGPGHLLENHTVIVRGGRIDEVGPAGEIEIPEGARVIDGHGLFLMPGLTDVHVHVWDADEFALYQANGVTAVRNMWGSEQQLEWRRQIEAGTWNCVTLIVMQRWASPEEAGPFLEKPVMRHVSPSTKESWNPKADFRRQRTSKERYAAIREGNKACLAVTRALHEAAARGRLRRRDVLAGRFELRVQDGRGLP